MEEKENLEVVNDAVVQDEQKRGIEVRLVNLTKEFVDKTGKVTVAVNDMNITIPSGKLIGLLGPSGCGKSTTLYMICGLHRPTRGEIFFGDENVTNYPPEKRGIGLVFQNYALYPHLTVKQNIMFPLENVRPRIPKDEIIAKVQEVANLVQIGELLERKPNQLSGGQQQRVAIARALVKQPRVLLLDEPLSNLDARLRLQTREEIKRIQRETGVTTIFVTHDQEEAMSISDEIVVMDNGMQMQMDHPQEVYESPNRLFVAKFLGTPQINIVEGYVEDQKVKLLNGEIIASAPNIADQKVKIGLRPEFFELNENGELKATIEMIQNIGRDALFVCKLHGYEETIKIIVPSVKGYYDGQEISFKLKQFFLFDNTEEGGRLL